LTKLGDVNGGLGLVFATLRLTTALSTYTLLLERLDTFLSLPELDPDETAIETYVGMQSAKNLKPLIDYLASRKDQDFRRPFGSSQRSCQRTRDTFVHLDGESL